MKFATIDNNLNSQQQRDASFVNSLEKEAGAAGRLERSRNDCVKSYEMKRALKIGSTVFGLTVASSVGVGASMGAGGGCAAGLVVCPLTGTAGAVGGAGVGGLIGAVAGIWAAGLAILHDMDEAHKEGTKKCLMGK